MTPLSQTIQLQQIASNPQNSAWVFASAGSGKTKILTDRVLRLLLDDVSPNKILCLTFTKVAAAEMQNRINLELAQWILCDDATLQKKLEALSGRFPTQSEIKKARTLFVKILDSDAKIKVQTIHSFCQILIKIFPFEAKVKPNFEVMEGSREKLLLKEAQKEVLKQALTNETLKNLVQQTNARLHEESFSELVATLLNKKEQLTSLKEKFFGIENVIAEISKNFAIPKNQTDAAIFAEFVTKINPTQNSQLCESLDASGSSKNEDVSTRIRNFLQNPILENLENYKLAFFTKENEPRKIYGKANNDANIDFMAQCQKLILDFLEQLNSLKIINDTALLLRFIDHILENYSRLKKQNSFLDYNDLIVETNNLLANPDFSDWVKLKMDSSFDHILIDESQDTNHQQWNIIKALSEDFFSGMSASNNVRSIFIVGDEKQSIYSFQGAEPNISAEIFSYFKERLGEQLQKIELNNSFRSTSKILKAVDLVFSDPSRKSAISKASEFQEHKPIREGVGKVEIWPQIQKAKAEKKEKNYEWEIDFSKKAEPQEEEVLAEIIARKIKARVETTATKYGDFMILLRNRTNGFSDALIKSFHKYNIPFSSVSKVKFSESLIICDLLAAAKFALLPQDDLNLACLLKSPIFEVSEEELFEICRLKNAQTTTIFQALTNSEIKKDLAEIISKSQELNCFEFFYFLLNEKNHQQNLIAHFGYESLEILDKFILSAFDFCQNFSPDLQKFLEFIEKLDPEISLSDSESDCVRISTIHSAKGLQAPIVMLPDCCYNFNQLLSAKEEISWVEFDGEKFPIWCRRKDGENRLLKQHRKIKLAEAKEEYLRLLYVGMTRPEDELYVGGFGGAKDLECWYEVVKNSLGGFADFVAEEEFLKLAEVTALDGGPRNECGVTSEGRSLPIVPSGNLKVVTPSLRRGPVSALPSQINHSQIKGRLIHKILEIIGKNHQENQTWLLQIIKSLIAKEEFLNEAEKNAILAQTSSFLDSPHFQKLFSGKIKCEVEITGNNTLSRIDLLVETENEILIVDYKSDETLPNTIPQHYVTQLKNYEKLVQNLYPNKKISCAILWVKFLKLENL